MVYFHRMFSDSSYKIGSLYHSPSEGCCLRQGEIPEQSIQKCDLSLFVLQNEERGWVLQQKMKTLVRRYRIFIYQQSKMRIFSVTKDILVSLSLGSVRIEVNFNAHCQNCLLLVGGLRDLSLRSIPLTPRNKPNFVKI